MIRVDVYLRAKEATAAPSAEWVARLSERWQQVAERLQQIGTGEIAHLTELEISLVDDKEMSQVHHDFLADPSPTDVITFEHGELLVGVETALRQAKEFESSQHREIALYGIHGMLHLAGYDDQAPDDASRMELRQFELLAQFFPEL